MQSYATSRNSFVPENAMTYANTSKWKRLFVMQSNAVTILSTFFLSFSKVVIVIV
jgi:hypothetical protein